MPQPQPRKKTCDDAQFASILANSPVWLKVFLQLCRTLGLRHEEAKQLRPADLNEDTRTLVFNRKGWGTSSLPVTEDLLEAIRFCRTQDPDATILSTLGAPEGAQAVLRAFHSARRKANADPELHIHDLRRTGATRLYQQTKDLRLVQQFLGHRQLAATFQYLAPLPSDELSQAIENAAPVDIRNLTNATEVKQ